jgi:L-lactate dehydrogenase complex protein LldF
MLLDLRREAEEGRQVSKLERLTFGVAAAVLEYPSLYRLTARLARLFQWPFLRGGRLRRLPGPLAGWTQFRDLPPVAAKPFHVRWKELEGGLRS